jgi:N-acetylmuramoyl-L-alanine amidase
MSKLLKQLLSAVGIILTFQSSIANASLVSSSSLKREVRCMAANIYHEARGESITGQKAVASVTMNRVKSDSYPKSVCGVVHQKSQFSWTGSKPIPQKIPKKIVDIARQYVVQYNSKSMDVTAGATYFHTVTTRPSWSKRFKRTTRIGNHIFYRQSKNHDTNY